MTFNNEKPKTLLEVFNELNIGDYIELKSEGNRLSNGVWIVYKKCFWGFARVERAGYYNSPGDSTVLIRDFDVYNERWRPLTAYNKEMYHIEREVIE